MNSIPSSIRNLLVEKGYYLFRYCKCGGYYREYWRNQQFKGHEIAIYPYAHKMANVTKNPTAYYMKFTKLVEELPIAELETLINKWRS